MSTNAEITYPTNGVKLPVGCSAEYVQKMNDVLSLVAAEVQRAKTMFPTHFHNQHEAYAVLLEEIDELWAEIKKNQRNYDLELQRKEAKQAAAMLVRLMVELL
jgi:L-ascorbate metabolism protein UlaG (beta-lactamase superfamily)